MLRSCHKLQSTINSKGMQTGRNKHKFAIAETRYVLASTHGSFCWPTDWQSVQKSCWPQQQKKTNKQKKRLLVSAQFKHQVPVGLPLSLHAPSPTARRLAWKGRPTEINRILKPSAGADHSLRYDYTRQTVPRSSVDAAASQLSVFPAQHASRRPLKEATTTSW